MLPARWLLLLMGFFACYAGWIYNDFLSIPLTISNSCYNGSKKLPSGEDAYNRIENCVYPFGIDPKWYISSN